MAAPNGNKNAIGNNGGNPGYGKLAFIREQVEKHSKLWWTEWLDMMKSKPDEFINENVKELLNNLIDKGDEFGAKEIIKDLARGAFTRKQFAMSEFNKLQTKMIPTQLTGEDDGPIKHVFQWIQEQSQSNTNRGSGRKPSTKATKGG